MIKKSKLSKNDEDEAKLKKLEKIVKQGIVEGTKENLFFKSLQTLSKGYSEDKLVEVEVSCAFNFHNLKIEDKWLAMGNFDKNEEFFWSIESAFNDALSNLVKEHGAFLLKVHGKKSKDLLEKFLGFTDEDNKKGLGEIDYFK